MYLRIVAISLLLAGCQSGNVHRYVGEVVSGDPGPGGFASVAEIDYVNQILHVDNLGLVLLDCGNARYRCMYGIGFEFAVPRNEVVLPDSWTHRNYTYRVVGRSEDREQLHKIFAVSSDDSERDNNFSYSYRSGLKSFCLYKGVSSERIMKIEYRR